MNAPDRFDPEFEQRLAALLLDVLIRAGLILAVVMLCFQVFFSLPAPHGVGADPGSSVSIPCSSRSPRSWVAARDLRRRCWCCWES